MPASRPKLDAREVDRFDALMTVEDASTADAFLERCRFGSSWRAQIRTADVGATVLSRSPLGTFDERVCTCVRLHLDRPVPVEPGLRLQILADDDSGLVAKGVVRPWTR